jgi:hypothetical protein
VAATGAIALPFDTAVMARGVVGPDGRSRIGTAPGGLR